jgi:hypothetical protein
MTYQLNRPRTDTFSTNKILEELKAVAIIYSHKRFGWRDFDKTASISGSVVKNHFKGWNNAILALEKVLGFNLELETKKQISESELFTEMDRIWKHFGHRPSRNEWESVNPKFHYNTYKVRFGGWQKACYEFIAFKTDFNPDKDNISPLVIEKPLKKTQAKKEIISRNVSPGLKIKVLQRDNMRCCYCGQSPATNFGVILNIDHIIPFAKGGKTEIENLQTLCFDCNIGKGDKII